MGTPLAIRKTMASNPSRQTPIHVTCFVDWNSQLLSTGIQHAKAPVEAASAAFRQITRQIAKSLAASNIDANFLANLRLYHGWRKGYEPTNNFRAIRKVIAETDFSTASDNPRVSYDANVGYGDCLLSASTERMHKKHGIHLPNTLRDRGHLGFEEKMVDTALAVDMVVRAYQYRDEWILLVTEDDDLIPPLFTAESIINPNRARVLLLSKRNWGNNMLLLNGLDVSLGKK